MPDIVIVLLGTYVEMSKSADLVSSKLAELKDCVNSHLVNMWLLLKSEIDSLTS